MGIGGFHLEHITTMRDTVETYHVLLAEIYPFAFRGYAFNAIGIVALILAGIVEGSKADGQVALVGRDTQRLSMQDRYVTVLSIVMEGGEKYLRLICRLGERLRIEGDASHRCADCDIIGGWVVERTTLGERHVVVEIVRSKDIRLTCLGVVFVNTRFPDNPDVVGVVFYQTLYDTLVQVDVLQVVHGDVVLDRKSVV